MPTETVSGRQDQPSTSYAVEVVEEAPLPPGCLCGLQFSWRKLMRFAGPGLLMSIAYMDPGNLESALQVGAQTGYILLWVLAGSICMGYLVQMQAARLGVVTGQHLAEHCRTQYNRPTRIVLWLLAESAIIGADIQEVIGSAIALLLLSRGYIPLWAGVLLSGVNSFVLLLVERAGVRYLELVFALLIGTMSVTFGYIFCIAGVDLEAVASGFLVPSMPRYAIAPAVALIGSLIMPHNVYLHSALVQTRGLAVRSPAAKREGLAYFGIEAAFSLTVALMVNLFIVGVFAKGFFAGPGGAPDIGLETAGKYLGQAFGAPVAYIWAVGLLAAGLSSTMTGTYTGQFVMDGFLRLRLPMATRIMVTRVVSLVPTLGIALAARGTSTNLDSLNQGLNLLQSLQLPFALVPVLAFTCRRSIMGEFASSWLSRSVTWSIAAAVMCVNALGVWQVSEDWRRKGGWAGDAGLVLAVVVYTAFVVYIGLVGGRRQKTVDIGDVATAAVSMVDDSLPKYGRLLVDGFGSGNLGSQHLNGSGNLGSQHLNGSGNLGSQHLNGSGNLGSQHLNGSGVLSSQHRTASGGLGIREPLLAASDK